MSWTLFVVLYFGMSVPRVVQTVEFGSEQLCEEAKREVLRETISITNRQAAFWFRRF